jgi:hypothetical protein
MSRSSSLRASDADRDAVADRLHRAAVEGRLEPEELEERLHKALRARTYGELRRLVADLPGTPARRTNTSLALTALKLSVRVVLALVVIAAVITVAVVMAAWWIVWILLWMTMRGRRYGWARPRSRRHGTPPFIAHAARFPRASSRSWP